MTSKKHFSECKIDFWIFFLEIYFGKRFSEARFTFKKIFSESQIYIPRSIFWNEQKLWKKFSYGNRFPNFPEKRFSYSKIKTKNTLPLCLNTSPPKIHNNNNQYSTHNHCNPHLNHYTLRNQNNHPNIFSYTLFK